MHKKQSLEIYKAMQLALTQKAFLRQIGMTKKHMLTLLDKDVWVDKIATISLEEEVSCKAIIQLCEDSFHRLVEDAPAEGWLLYIYHYLIKNIYPHRSDIAISFDGKRIVLFYLEVLRIFLEVEKAMHAFDRISCISFASEEDMENSVYQKEYQRFLTAFHEEYIYELMRIGREVMPFNLLSHVAGVHYISMHVARQLEKANAPVDLGLVSAAAAGHDIGKFGCMDTEAGRLPYLHYYYTDIWFKNNELHNIGHIAANHSTWDLELENLPVESLILIYADFRVKTSGYEDGKEVMGFYSLDESFRVILSKLDHVDTKKENRYRHVYSRLLDFEKYLVSLGVNVDLTRDTLAEVVINESDALTSTNTVATFKNIAFDHNIRLMHKLSRETSFGTILETARSTTSWKDSRAYLNIFSEYFTYMTGKQKLMTLTFLYELMINREGDIRRQAGELLGKIIANYDKEYGKELPKDVQIVIDTTNSLEIWEKYMALIITPDHRMIDRHRRWLGYGLKRVVISLIENCKKDKEDSYIQALLSYFKETDWNADTAFILMDTLSSIPDVVLKKDDLMTLLDFMMHYATHPSLEIRAAILLNILDMAEDYIYDKDLYEFALKIASSVPNEKSIGLEFLRLRISEKYHAVKLADTISTQKIFESNEVVSDIFLENLKAATPWKIKIINIMLLQERITRGFPVPKLHVATHLSNLLKVSEQVTVRYFAGETLVKLAPLLTLDQRNEVAIELTKGLEIGEFEFSKYIPQYLGKLALYLHPKELDEFIIDIHRLQNSTNDKIASVALDTFGIMLQHYSAYSERFQEDEAIYKKRWKRILGKVLSGFANYQVNVTREAFWVIGHELFASSLLNLEEKKDIFTFINKKLPLLVESSEVSELAFFNNSANWNFIYRFISDYLFEHNEITFYEPEKIAFFPGTFDPFSLGHKEIATEIRDMGFIVYLALDEFSWSKRTQPHKIRRRIINMSVANEENIFLFPEDIPINIANPNDLRRLRELFGDKEVYMVAGSDVVKNASSYKIESNDKNAITTFPHILFLRESDDVFNEEFKDSNHSIKNTVLSLKLPMHFEDISSTRIRENIDQNREISNLISTVAQNYIYEKGLYLREPQYKKLLESSAVEIEHYASTKLALKLIHETMGDSPFTKMLFRALEDGESQMTVIYDKCGNGKPDGILIYRYLPTTELYQEFHDMEITSYIRENTSGKIVVFSAYFVNDTAQIDDLEQLLLTESLAQCLSEDATFAIFSPRYGAINQRVLDVLERQGFVPLNHPLPDRQIYIVDMKNPITLSHNVQTAIKEPFNTNENVLKVLGNAHIRIQKALTKLFPGELVISFDWGIMHKRITDLITKANGVTKEPTPVRKLGPCMAVPFGKIMKGVVVPNTVTKVLHTEKEFDSQIKSFKIREFPQYLPLDCQVRTIKSFRRPVILVDDLLHKGYRIQELDPIFKEEALDIDKIIVGILSGRGRDLMEVQYRQVESAYFLPSLRAWFVETTMYPFIGGDGVEQHNGQSESLFNSINLILPYVMPGFVTGANKEAVYDLSMICLENAKDILQVLEREYQRQFERSLTLGRLSEVIISPRCPDNGDCMKYDTKLATSVYVENDIERLVRLKHLVK